MIKIKLKHLIIVATGAALFIVAIWSFIRFNPVPETYATKTDNKKFPQKTPPFKSPIRPNTSPDAKATPIDGNRIGMYSKPEWCKLNPTTVEFGRGEVQVNPQLLASLHVTPEELDTLNTILLENIKKLNTPSNTKVIIGGLPPARYRKGAVVYTIRDLETASQEKEDFKSAIIATLGNERGKILNERLILPTDGDPYLRGFGQNSLELIIKEVGKGDPKIAMVHWDYKVIRPDGTTAGEGQRHTPGLPAGLNSILKISDEMPVD